MGRKNEVIRPSRKYMVSYAFTNEVTGRTGFGYQEITQDSVYPITPDVLIDAVRIIKENDQWKGMPVTIVPISWQRFEEYDS